MRFTEHEMVFFNSITKGNDVFGIPLKFRPQKGHEEEVKKTINGLIEKGVLASETELTKMGFCRQEHWNVIRKAGIMLL